MNRIIERWWTIWGHMIHLRIEPPQFRAELRKLSAMVDTARSRVDVAAAKAFTEEMYRRWGSDPEIIRLDYLNDFFHDEEA